MYGEKSSPLFRCIYFNSSPAEKTEKKTAERDAAIPTDAVRNRKGSIFVGRKLIASNKKAKHDYFIENTYEAGIVLTGTEIKSIRQGKVQLKPLISKHFAFRDYLKAYKYIDENRETTMKVIINVQE